MTFRALMLLILGIPKTIFFNFRYFKFKDAIQFPVLVSHSVILNKMKGNVIILSPIKPGMIKLGFFESPFLYKQSIKSYWNVEGTVTFKGKASLGKGTKIRCFGNLYFGDNLRTSGTTDILCKHTISFGDETVIGWDCIFMDDDNHVVVNKSGINKTKSKDIQIGNRVWFGMNCTILKGIQVGNDVVVAANSCIVKTVQCDNCVIGGSPAKLLKKDIEWHQ